MSQDLVTTINLLATTLGNDIEALLSAQGDLTALTTAQKSSLVGSINELKSQIGNIDLTSLINDSTTGADTTWSSEKIDAKIDAAVNALVNGAPGAMDTLRELAAEITSNDGQLNQLLAAQAKRVAVDKAQSFSDAEKAQGRDNPGAAGASDVSALSNQLGDVDGADFVATYRTAKG